MPGGTLLKQHQLSKISRSRNALRVLEDKDLKHSRCATSAGCGTPDTRIINQ